MGKCEESKPKTHCKTGENNIKSGHFYGAISHWQGWAGRGDKANAHYDVGGENNLMKSMPTMMRVEKTRQIPLWWGWRKQGKGPLWWGWRKQTRPMPTMMRVEKTRQRPTITMSMREEKCECGEKKRTKNEAKSHRVDRGRKESEWFSPLTKHDFTLHIHTHTPATITTHKTTTYKQPPLSTHTTPTYTCV